MANASVCRQWNSCKSEKLFQKLVFQTTKCRDFHISSNGFPQINFASEWHGTRIPAVRQNSSVGNSTFFHRPFHSFCTDPNTLFFNILVKDGSFDPVDYHA
jgi:hypothetical protein